MAVDRVNPANSVNLDSDGKWHGVTCQNQDSQDGRIFRIMNGDG